VSSGRRWRKPRSWPGRSHPAPRRSRRLRSWPRPSHLGGGADAESSPGLGCRGDGDAKTRKRQHPVWVNGGWLLSLEHADLDGDAYPEPARWHRGFRGAPARELVPLGGAGAPVPDIQDRGPRRRPASATGPRGTSAAPETASPGRSTAGSRRAATQPDEPTRATTKPTPLCCGDGLRHGVLWWASCWGFLDGMQEVSWPTPTLSDVGEQCAAAASSRPG
jgi:hypothetical protein